MPYKLPTRLNKDIATSLLKNVDNFLFDCDGVVWNWPKAIQGSVELINKLKQIGKRCFFITNNSTKTRQMVLDMAKTLGIKDINESDIVCTSWLLASYLKSLNFKDKVYVIGSPAIGHELDMQNIRHIGIGSNTKQIPDPAAFDYMNSLELDSEVKCVTVGFDIHFNYPKIVTATSYAHKNPECLFIATNDDAQFPTESTKVVIPGTGTFVNALRTSIGRVPVILGKPHRTMWEVLHNLHGLDPNRTCMVGDRLDTDIAFAANCSLAFSLAVLSGVTSEDEIKEHARYIEANDLGNEKAKCVPDFYARSLGELEEFIREHSD